MSATEPVPDDYNHILEGSTPDDDWWVWRVEGADGITHSSTPPHWDDTGRVRAECAPEVVLWLISHGPLDGLDWDDTVTITVRPLAVDELPAPSR
jgi:hypothetical protein